MRECNLRRRGGGCKGRGIVEESGDGVRRSNLMGTGGEKRVG